MPPVPSDRPGALPPRAAKAKKPAALFRNQEDDEDDPPRRRRDRREQGSGAVHSLGVGSMVLGVVALLFSFIPCVGMVSLPLSGLGLLLGLVGGVVALLRRGRGIGFPIAGSAINGMALLIGLFWVHLATSTTSALEDAARRARASTRALEEAAKKDSETNQTRDDGGPKNGTPASGEKQPPRSQEPEWADAKEAMRQGDVRVAITSVTLGKVEVSSFGGKRESKDDLLAVRLRVENLSETRKIEVSGWGDSGFLSTHVPTLTDNFGNTYRRIDFGFGTRVEGQMSSTSIRPGKSVEDVIVCEEPVARAEYLRLELPASAFGGTGKLRFRNPKSMIERR